MLNSLKLKNFRCFKEFELQQLGHVNLLVGKNNCGKTSILEAIHILDSENPRPFRDAIKRRGESVDKIHTIDSISHFCYGHKILRGRETKIVGNTNDESVSFTLSVIDEVKNKQTNGFDSSSMEPPKDNILFTWSHSKGISFNYQGLSFDHLERSEYQPHNNIFVALTPSEFSHIGDLFNEIVITPREETLYEALRFIEPTIRRIAPVKNRSFMVAINDQRVPIGSMGDGIGRMLEIALAMVNVSGGILLIDEIDTGLHFSVMIDLWRLICKTAQKLDIQVFATTHSSDCWKSLAEVAQSNEFPETEITIHRIERGKKASVVFDEREMAIAAERDIEVR